MLCTNKNYCQGLMEYRNVGGDHVVPYCGHTWGSAEQIFNSLNILNERYIPVTFLQPVVSVIFSTFHML